MNKLNDSFPYRKLSFFLPARRDCSKKGVKIINQNKSNNFKSKKKSRTKALCMEDLIPDSERWKELLCRLYNNDSLSGKGSIFTDMLQSIINAVATIIFSVVFCQIDFTFDEPFVLLNCLKFQ